MEFASTGELIRAAGHYATDWGDALAGIEHAAVAVLERTATATRAADHVRIATAISTAREGAVGSQRFGKPGAVHATMVSTELRRALEPLTQRLPADAVEWLEWVERILRASSRPLLRTTADDVAALLGGPRPRVVAGGQARPVPFTLDLTELAENGSLGPVFGREAELAILIRVLGRRIKNHPVLIGPPGVGKTAIVELLVSRIADGSAPPQLRGRRVLQLNVGELLAGTRYRGDLEDRLIRLVRGLRELPAPALLFIDEVHLLVGAGSSEGSAVDLGNLLKPALARGTIQVIGATTDLEYDERIRQDPALERRLHPIRIGEPTLADTARILDRLRPSLESHHGVNIPPGVARRAALMSSALRPERYQPDKAIDLLDEACSHRRGCAGSITLSVDDILAVASSWPSRDQTLAFGTGRELPASSREVLTSAIVAALADASLLAVSPTELIEVTGLAGTNDLLADLRSRIGDVATVEVDGTSIVLGAVDEGVTPGPRVVILTEDSPTASTARAGLVLRFPDLGGEMAERAIRRLIRVLAGSTGRVSVEPAAMRAWVRTIAMAGTAEDNQALRTLQRQISETVTKELPWLAADRDLILGISDTDQGVMARQVKRRTRGARDAE
jgi:hypothetical protein